MSRAPLSLPVAILMEIPAVLLRTAFDSPRAFFSSLSPIAIGGVVAGVVLLLVLLLLSMFHAKKKEERHTEKKRKAEKKEKAKMISRIEDASDTEQTDLSAEPSSPDETTQTVAVPGVQSAETSGEMVAPETAPIQAASETFAATEEIFPAVETEPIASDDGGHGDAASPAFAAVAPAAEEDATPDAVATPLFSPVPAEVSRYVSFLCDEEPPFTLHASVEAEEVNRLMSTDEARATVAVSTRPGNGGKNAAFLTLDTLSDAFLPLSYIDLDVLHRCGMVPLSFDALCIRAQGRLNRPLMIRADSFSAEAVKMIALTGGRAILNK